MLGYLQCDFFLSLFSPDCLSCSQMLSNFLFYFIHILKLFLPRVTTSDYASSFATISGFYGSLDGNNHKIIGLNASSNAMFKDTNNVTIKDLVLVSPKVLSTTVEYTGLLIGNAKGTTVIENIEVNGVLQAVNNKTVNLAVPTAVSDLTNDLNFATQSFVNSSIAANAARFITPTAAGTTPWASFNDLTTALTYYNAGTAVTLSNNDYAVFLKTVSGATEQWRAVYQEVGGQGQWMEQYKIGSAFTAAQQAAIDSGITSTLVGKISTNEADIVTINNTFSNYLPLAGGTMSGAVNFSNTDFIKANNAQATLSRVLSYSNTSNNILLGSSGWSNIEISNTLLPDTDNTLDIGSSTKYFKDAYIKGDIYTNGDIYANGNKLELPSLPGTVALVSNITTAINTVDLEITALQNNKANMTDTTQTVTVGNLVVNGNSITINGATITYNSTTQTWEI